MTKRKTISMLAPSRGRPLRFRTMVDEALRLATHPKRLEVLLLVDEDDPQLAGYLNMPACVRRLVSPKRIASVPAAQNWLASQASGELLLIATDDVIIRTPGWDVVLEEAFARWPDGLGLVYTNCGRDKVENFAVTSRWVRVAGSFLHPDYEHFSADEHAGELAKRIGRALFLPKLVTEHMHFKHGKAARDDTYAAKRTKDARGRSVSDRDQERFRALAADRDAAVARLVAALGTPWVEWEEAGGCAPGIGLVKSEGVAP